MPLTVLERQWDGREKIPAVKLGLEKCCYYLKTTVGRDEHCRGHIWPVGPQNIFLTSGGIIWTCKGRRGKSDYKLFSLKRSYRAPWGGARLTTLPTCNPSSVPWRIHTGKRSILPKCNPPNHSLDCPHFKFIHAVFHLHLSLRIWLPQMCSKKQRSLLLSGRKQSCGQTRWWFCKQHASWDL